MVLTSKISITKEELEPYVRLHYDTFGFYNLSLTKDLTK